MIKCFKYRTIIIFRRFLRRGHPVNLVQSRLR